MNTVNLASVDLNLLHVVATVLEEGSATRAAAKLHVTQSAVSNSLRRAREIFDDRLVLREPHGLSPTPRAVRLLPALRAWLEEARRMVANAPSFAPATSTRSLGIACSDSLAIILLRPLLASLRVRAPGIRLRFLTLDRLIAADALARGEADLLIGMPPVLAAAQEAELLYRDPMKCIVRRDHPRVGRRLGLDTFASLPHVDLALFGTLDDRVDRALARHGKSRVVAVTVPHFATVPLAVLETDGVATLSERLARTFAADMPLKVLTPPVELEPIEIRQVWHRRSAEDEAVLFLRSLIRDIATKGNGTRSLARSRASTGFA